jgi:hypothetical protein
MKSGSGMGERSTYFVAAGSTWILGQVFFAKNKNILNVALLALYF